MVWDMQIYSFLIRVQKYFKGFVEQLAREKRP